MSLRQHLTELLPELLPADPGKSIKGTELIHLVRLKLDGDYSEASLRYHFSIMSCDPASPIAKVEKGQGYYLRGARVPALSGAQEIFSQYQGFLDDMQGDEDQIDLTMMRIGKFRAVVKKWCELNAYSPFAFREPFQADSQISNLWKFPEMVLINWSDNTDQSQNKSLRKIKTQLGIPNFRLRATRLRIQGSHTSYREDFFQTLSASIWANAGELIYAAPIEDEALSDSLRSLSDRFGIGILTFGLTTEILDSLPRSEHIANASPRETDALMEKLDITRIGSCRHRTHLDWEALENIRGDSPDVDKLITWLSENIENRNHATPEDHNIKKTPTS